MAQNKIQGTAKLRRLNVGLIDKEQWSSLGADVRGDAFEKSGPCAYYFTSKQIAFIPSRFLPGDWSYMLTCAAFPDPSFLGLGFRRTGAFHSRSKTCSPREGVC
jgi:hypothetical protein